MFAVLHGQLDRRIRLQSRHGVTAEAVVMELHSADDTVAKQACATTITGFDDIPSAKRAQLTTIWQPLVKKGEVAGEMILGNANGRLTTRHPADTAHGPPDDRAGSRGPLLRPSGCSACTARIRAARASSARPRSARLGAPAVHA